MGRGGPATPRQVNPFSLTYFSVSARLNGLLSSAISTNTGTPQGTVLAPFLFALYTAHCRSTDESCPLVKFADVAELVGKISIMMKTQCVSF